MWIFLSADAMSFGGLLAAYGALRYYDPTWPLPSSILGINSTAGMTFLLIITSMTMVQGLAAIRQGDQQGLQKFLALTVAGGILFLVCQYFEWTHLLHAGQSIQRDNFGATFFLTTGFHGLHVFSGVCYLTIILLRARLGKYSAACNYEVEIAALYWHFVDLIWILVFTFIYLM
jgi:heme/copper-type cytochrome/quinol oxidase subunit 3